MKDISQGYIYKCGKMSSIKGEHWRALGDVSQAIEDGVVRIRDFGHVVAFQGRSKNIVRKAIECFAEKIRYPYTVCLEWPGHYSEE